MRKTSLLLGALFLFSCGDDSTQVNVTSRQNPNVNLNNYRTFALSTIDQLPTSIAAQIPSNVQANLDYIQALVRNELTARGLTEVSLGGNPSEVVQVLSWTEQDTAVQYTCVPGAWWYGYWYYAWDPCAWLSPELVSLAAGAVIVALADPANQLVTYGGTLTGTSIDASLEDERSAFEDGINRMFDAYPSLSPTP